MEVSGQRAGGDGRPASRGRIDLRLRSGKATPQRFESAFKNDLE
jgi:hypothetical protein